jgi:hypothetical protein
VGLAPFRELGGQGAPRPDLGDQRHGLFPCLDTHSGPGPGGELADGGPTALLPPKSSSGAHSAPRVLGYVERRRGAPVACGVRPPPRGRGSRSPPRSRGAPRRAPGLAHRCTGDCRGRRGSPSATCGAMRALRGVRPGESRRTGAACCLRAGPCNRKEPSIMQRERAQRQARFWQEHFRSTLLE